jgi:RimJ/RimL family protein N-acetyltransferase
MSYATKPAHRVVAGASVAPRPRRGWIPHWLRPGGSRLPGHRPRPEVTGRPVALRDGSKVRIRPVQPADAALLADGFARLSDKSRRMRFLARKDQLSAAELRYFTDLDHHDHEALGAVSQASGRGVGVARYIRHAGDPHAAEIAITVVDQWQGRGLGTELLTRLSGRARAAGIHRFTALVAADNTAMAGLLRKMNASLAGRSPGTAEYEITLTPPGKSTATPAAGLCPDRVPTPC